MNRLVPLGFLGALGILLAGCPIFDDSHGRPVDDCRGDGCMAATECKAPSDCSVNETCGADNQCHSGDCTFWGCSGGLACVIDEKSTASCQAPVSSGDATSSSSGAGGSGEGGASGSGGAGGASAAKFCGHPADCAADETCGQDGLCQPGDCSTVGCIFGFGCSSASGQAACVAVDPTACGADGDCAVNGEGFACVSGHCTSPDDQCLDQTQCSPGSRCAAGKCTKACSADAECTAGFGCDTGRGVCTRPLTACAVTNDCGGADHVCVGGACVPRGTDGVCDAGYVAVQNGCILDQVATVSCAIEGVQDACADGAICLHHGCYIACDADPLLCDVPPNEFNVCKEVKLSGTGYQVCGSSHNLGADCNPSSACPSASDMCVDGFCL